MITIDTQTGAGTAVGPTKYLNVSALAFIPPGSICAVSGDVNDDGVRDGLDIAGFVRVKLNAALPGDNPACANYGTGTVPGDTALFVADLLGS